MDLLSACCASVLVESPVPVHVQAAVVVTPVISFQTVKRSAISWRHPLADSRCRRGRKCGEMRLNADLGDHTHGPLTQLRRIPPRRTTCHDSNPPKKWSLRTSRGGSHVQLDTRVRQTGGEIVETSGKRCPLDWAPGASETTSEPRVPME